MMKIEIAAGSDDYPIEWCNILTICFIASTFFKKKLHAFLNIIFQLPLMKLM